MAYDHVGSSSAGLSGSSKDAANHVPKCLGGIVDHEEHPADRKAVPAEDRDQGQAVSLRHLPQAEPAAGEDAGAVVLPDVHGSGWRSSSRTAGS